MPTDQQNKGWLHFLRVRPRDNPLPWHKPMDKLTPGRVAQAMGGVLAAVGTPTSPPKPRGKSLGWTPGKVRIRRIRYPIVKKTATKPRKEQPKSA